MSEGDASFADALRRWRTAAGHTQESLAVATGLSTRAISYLETGRVARPRQSTLSILTAALRPEPDELRRLMQAPPGRLAVPRQLPSLSACYVGRVSQMSAAGAAASGGTVIVTGMPGIGKTSFAVRLAALWAGDFPDGCLFADLYGFDERCRAPGEVLAEFLRAVCGTAAKLPARVDELAALYRSVLADRRCLVVLDNVSSEAQVRPLMPAGGGSVVIITSRRALAGLDVDGRGGVRIALPVLNEAEGLALLTSMVGLRRVQAEPVAAGELVSACAGLPLALGIVGAQLATRPDWPLSELAARLRDETRRLGQLVAGDRAVAAAFTLSCRLLSEVQARMFRRLGVVAGPTISAAAAGVLMGMAEEPARAVLDELVIAGLAEPGEVPGRYRLHDLARLYAKDLAANDSGSHRAFEDLVNWYVASSDAAARLVAAGMVRMPRQPAADTQPLVFTTPAQANAWLHAERANLVMTACAAVERGVPHASWQLADALRGFFFSHRYMREWADACHAGLVAARAAGERQAEAAMRHSLGLLHAKLDDHQAALADYQAAAKICEQIGWHKGQAAAIGNAGAQYQILGQMEQARPCFLKALEINTRLGDRHGQAIQLGNLASIARKRGDLGQATRLYTRTLNGHLATGNLHGQAVAHSNLAGVLLDAGRPAEATQHYRTALELAQILDSPVVKALAYKGLADVDLRRGQFEDGAGLAKQAVDVAWAIRDAMIHADALNILGRLHQACGRHATAVKHLRTALRLGRRAGDRLGQTQSLLGLADCHRSTRRHRRVNHYATLALRLASQDGYRREISQARQMLPVRHGGSCGELRSLTPAHPDVLFTRSWLAHLRRRE